MLYKQISKLVLVMQILHGETKSLELMRHLSLLEHLKINELAHLKIKNKLNLVQIRNKTKIIKIL